MPLWRDHYLARDQRPSYAYLRKILQVLQWLRGGTRWVLKSPQHLEQFPALVETFPDATFVVTHRDPVSVTASMVMMLAYSARLTRDRVDLAAIGHYWADRLESMLRALRRGARRPARRTRPSTCTSTSSWPTTWQWWDASTSWRASRSTTRSAAAMTAFMAAHPRGKFGAVRVRPGRVRAGRRRAPPGVVLLHRALRT